LHKKELKKELHACGASHVYQERELIIKGDIKGN
jgi:hypothetical protein